MGGKGSRILFSELLTGSSWRWAVMALLLVNFLLRLLIYSGTGLFEFSDYAAYYGAVDHIESGDHSWLKVGNMLFTVSYMGYFAKYILGNISWFFIFNCAAGTLATYIISLVAEKVSGSRKVFPVTFLLLTVYTEFMVFSAVFYTPVIMLLLVSLFVLMLFLFFTSASRTMRITAAISATLLFLLTFFFKPELKYLPAFFTVAALLFYRSDRIRSVLTIVLSAVLWLSMLALDKSGLINKPEGDTGSNSFVFFGHTDYGGDGGEGTFIYEDNLNRYNENFRLYCERNSIEGAPAKGDYNRFQEEEMRKFIKEKPVRWIAIQVRKFFRTLGIMPESTSFRILVSGPLNGRVLISAIILVLPVALFVMALIFLFRPALPVQPGSTGSRWFIIIWLTMFFYYIIATVFYGQYQERYRLSFMVPFIIPAIAYFIATFEREQFFRRPVLMLKILAAVVFLSSWLLQAKEIADKKERYLKVIEQIKGSDFSKENQN